MIRLRATGTIPDLGVRRLRTLPRPPRASLSWIGTLAMTWVSYLKCPRSMTHEFVMIFFVLALL
jgi:hypothetical protein